MTRRYRAALVAIAMACALAVAACGSSKSGGSGATTSAGGSSSGSSGGSIKIMAIGPISAPQFSVPSIKVGAQAAVDAINRAGGVNGKQLDLIVCNDQNDPNTAVGCARDAVKQSVAALVGGYTAFEPQVVPIVERAGIPWIGPTALQNSTSPSYYLLGGEGAALAFAMALDLDRQQCHSISAIAENVPPSKAAVQLFQLGVAAGRGPNGAPVYGASNAADWSPVVAAALGKGADCLTFLGSVPNTAKVVTAVKQSGRAVKLAVPLSLLPAQAVQALGSAADGTILTSGYLPFTANAPAIRTLTQEARAIDPSVPLDSELESTYAAVQVLAAAARGLPTVTAATLRTALDGFKGFDTGLGPVVDFTARNPTRLFSRVTNTKVFVLKAQGGKVVLAQARPIDTAPAFAALAAAGK